MKQFSSAGIAKLFGLDQKQAESVMQNCDYPLPTDDEIDDDAEITKDELITLYYYLKNKGIKAKVPDVISKSASNSRKEF